VGTRLRAKERESRGHCSPWRVEPEATAGAERETKERARVDGDPGGAPADGEGAREASRT
jgi:hypothetical protein